MWRVLGCNVGGQDVLSAITFCVKSCWFVVRRTDAVAAWLEWEWERTHNLKYGFDLSVVSACTGCNFPQHHAAPSNELDWVRFYRQGNKRLTATVSNGCLRLPHITDKVSGLQCRLSAEKSSSDYKRKYIGLHEKYGSRRLVPNMASTRLLRMTLAGHPGLRTATSRQSKIRQCGCLIPPTNSTWWARRRRWPVS